MGGTPAASHALRVTLPELLAHRELIAIARQNDRGCAHRPL
jgi:hypothetical protein